MGGRGCALEEFVDLVERVLPGVALVARKGVQDRNGSARVQPAPIVDGTSHGRRMRETASSKETPNLEVESHSILEYAVQLEHEPVTIGNRCVGLLAIGQLGFQ